MLVMKAEEVDLFLVLQVMSFVIMHTQQKAEILFVHN
jgi:hypothetical protein